jgi:hypothetical protein
MFPQHHGEVQPYPEHVAPHYPGMLPPPVQYRKRRRWPLVVATLLAVAGVVAGLFLVVTVVTRTRESTGIALTDRSARVAIQKYLDALSHGDDETIARHTLCGLFDAVKERKSDLALAGLAADAFRAQFSRAEVTSIDKIVPWSRNQAQVLFTMRVAPAAGSSSRGQHPSNEEEQAVAQVLIQADVPAHPVLVCSYLLRTGAQY